MSSMAELNQLRLYSESLLRPLLNQDLKDICKSEHLAYSGIKSVLQDRIRNRMNDLADTGDGPALKKLTDAIQERSKSHRNQRMPSTVPMKDPPLPSPSLSGFQQASSHTPSTHSQHQSSHYAYGNRPPQQHQQQPIRTVQYKKSVFYDIVQPLVHQSELPAVGQHRSQICAKIKFAEIVATRIKTSEGPGKSSLRIMLFCCADPGYATSSQGQDIAFPGQIEVRVNNVVFAGNLRGLKKKPGTTCPADITDLLKFDARFENELSIAYAATERKYFFTVLLVRKHSIEQLVQQIKAHGRISKQSVINDMKSKANDPDIETTSSIMSLKCPISTMRLSLPCRSTLCTHNQCFDGTSFLQAQQQAPQWNCPLCYKVFDFTDVAVDEYVQDILNNSSRDTENVTIEPDGNWKPGNHINGYSNGRANGARGNGPKRKASEAFADDEDGEQDDDIIITSSTRFAKGSAPPSSTTDSPAGGVKLPQQQSATPSASRPLGNKKAAVEVIDLTLSSEEDDEEDSPPLSKIKRNRSFLGGTGVGLGLGSPGPSLGAAAHDTHTTDLAPRPGFTYRSPNDLPDWSGANGGLYNPVPPSPNYASGSNSWASYANPGSYTSAMPRPNPQSRGGFNSSRGSGGSYSTYNSSYG